ncbi:MAG: VWA domain-containing protein [Treponema sp.]|nr:VWA domain-containing protein [Candidatus Treponema caballi]
MASKKDWRKFVAAVLLLFCCAVLSAADLIVEVSDIRLESDPAGGYHLFIRKKADINSIMLTETTKDPEGKESNYAYRAESWNAINGDEQRILNGEFLVSEYGKYSLMDSTPESDEQFGSAFHIYIPEKLLYGYPWSRNGEILISKGTFINIRTFEKQYGDYTGGFMDNPFMFDFKTTRIPLPEPEPEPEVVLTDDYSPEAAAAFSEIAENLTYSKGPETIIQDIMDAFDKLDTEDIIDVVFCIDATGSMLDDIDQLRKELVPNMMEKLAKCPDVRYGLLLYRDYVDSFRYRGLPLKYFPFTRDTSEFLKNLNSFKIIGIEGGDIPEAVYEALYGAIEFYDWRPEAQRQVILIGDAEPHPKPRGTTIVCTRELIDELSAEKDVKIDAIITPDDKAARRKK